jgi:hypothetical protein
MLYIFLFIYLLVAKVPKEYPVNKVNPQPDAYYVVNRVHNESIIQFYNTIKKGGLHLLHGSRQSGKSTAVIQIIQQLSLEGFLPI